MKLSINKNIMMISQWQILEKKHLDDSTSLGMAYKAKAATFLPIISGVFALRHEENGRGDGEANARYQKEYNSKGEDL